ncbi:MAG: peptidylprolyl isomerase [Acidobacteria bacterium]|nr:peptidylprolyl isomerase [Acidobacteriota bacterium]
MSKISKYWTWLMLAVTLPLGTAPPAFGVTRLVERIIARVNNNIITQRQYDRERQKLREELARQYSGPQLEQELRKHSKDLLRDMIDQDLLVQKAKDDDINVETDLIKRLDEIRQQYNLPSLEALQEAVEKQGLIWEDFKDQIRRQLLMREVISQEVGSRILLSRADARKYFEAHKAQFDSPPGVHLAEVLVSTEKHKPAEAEELAKKALAEIQDGAHFAKVAEKYSDAPSARDGGDVGFFKAGTIAPTIEAAISKVDVGETSGIIHTQYGYMIFKVLERRVGKTPTFDQVEQQVTAYLYNEKVQDGLRTYLTTLRKESYIRMAPGFVDTGAPLGYDESY